MLLRLDLAIEHLLGRRVPGYVRRAVQPHRAADGGMDARRRPHHLHGGRPDAVDLQVPRCGSAPVPRGARQRIHRDGPASIHRPRTKLSLARSSRGMGQPRVSAHSRREQRAVARRRRVRRGSADASAVRRGAADVRGRRQPVAGGGASGRPRPRGPRRGCEGRRDPRAREGRSRRHPSRAARRRRFHSRQSSSTRSARARRSSIS